MSVTLCQDYSSNTETMVLCRAYKGFNIKIFGTPCSLEYALITDEFWYTW